MPFICGLFTRINGVFPIAWVCLAPPQAPKPPLTRLPGVASLVEGVKGKGKGKSKGERQRQRQNLKPKTRAKPKERVLKAFGVWCIVWF